MEVAIAQFGRRVSPRFDHASTFLVVMLKDGRVLKRREVRAKGLPPRERAAMLATQDVGTLICGGIDDVSAGELTIHGIEIYSSVTGDVEDVLSCLGRGELEEGMMMGAGGRCCGRWRSRSGAREARDEGSDTLREEMRPAGVGRGRGTDRRRFHQSGGTERRSAGRSGRGLGRKQGQDGKRRDHHEEGGANAGGI